MGGFVVDADGKPIAVFTAAAGLRAIVDGSTDVGGALVTQFETATPEATLNDVYHSAGKGLPIAVLDADGKLIGDLDPRDIMEEMGRVERLIDGFEREVYL